MTALGERFWVKTIPEPNSGCWLWMAARNYQGYGQFKVAGHQVQAHRVALRLSGVAVGDDDKVLHRCDTPPCVNPDHLWIGTCAANAADMVAKGRQAKGERNAKAKLTQDEVNEIRTRYSEGAITQAALSREYEVSDVMISYIVHGKNWRG